MAFSWPPPISDETPPSVMLGSRPCTKRNITFAHLCRTDARGNVVVVDAALEEDDILYALLFHDRGQQISLPDDRYDGDELLVPMSVNGIGSSAFSNAIVPQLSLIDTSDGSRGPLHHAANTATGSSSNDTPSVSATLTNTHDAVQEDFTIHAGEPPVGSSSSLNDGVSIQAFALMNRFIFKPLRYAKILHLHEMQSDIEDSFWEHLGVDLDDEASPVWQNDAYYHAAEIVDRLETWDAGAPGDDMTVSPPSLRHPAPRTGCVRVHGVLLTRRAPGVGCRTWS